jgi:hypothetical protein
MLPVDLNGAADVGADVHNAVETAGAYRSVKTAFPHTLALSSKCLARSNKSRGLAETTKG